MMRVQDKDPNVGRWVTAKLFAAHHSLHPQTLANWRAADRAVGRTTARDGYPTYRRYGSAVRYLLMPERQPREAA